MWSKIECRIGAWLLMAACSATSLACAKTASVCPARGAVVVQQIDLFDGPPQDQALLAPTDPDHDPNLYRLDEIYQQGRTVTIRCHYGDGQTRDVELKKPVKQCRYAETGKQHTPTLVCH